MTTVERWLLVEVNCSFKVFFSLRFSSPSEHKAFNQNSYLNFMVFFQYVTVEFFKHFHPSVNLLLTRGTKCDTRRISLSFSCTDIFPVWSSHLVNKIINCIII